MYLLWPLQIQSLGPPAPALALFPRLLSLLHASSSRKPSLKDPGLREPLCCRKIPPLGSFRPDHLSGSLWQPGAHSSQPLPGGRVTAIPMSQGTKAQQAGPSWLLSPSSTPQIPLPAVPCHTLFSPCDTVSTVPEMLPGPPQCMAVIRQSEDRRGVRSSRKSGLSAKVYTASGNTQKRWNKDVPGLRLKFDHQQTQTTRNIQGRNVLAKRKS
ncbi:uncharacterized protein LOC134472870 [Cavia porcellus]|uniref:uncharacterized protein LOC134472870 n=1 Tax=Cavia porcellus TaxID=10141 RepID=UPI002FDF660D